MTPGEAFDAPGYLRISYATSMEQLREGADAHPPVRRVAAAAPQGRRRRIASADALPCPWPSRVSSSALRAALGRARRRSTIRRRSTPYAADALGHGHPPDVVVLPGRHRAKSRPCARLCNEHRVPLVVRGAGTGYTGGAVPTRGGVVLSMERLNRILEIDEVNLLAVVEPNVITGDLQRAVEAVGLFYPPDPASLESSSIGGNVAECAGGPRAFKYGTTKRYVLALEAVLPTGEIVHTGSKAVKNVVGYDLTQLLVGSEGTLAIITRGHAAADAEAAGPRDAVGRVCRHPRRRRRR